MAELHRKVQLSFYASGAGSTFRSRISIKVWTAGETMARKYCKKRNSIAK